MSHVLAEAERNTKNAAKPKTEMNDDGGARAMTNERMTNKSVFIYSLKVISTIIHFNISLGLTPVRPEEQIIIRP